jgi:hypothetical protein
MSAYYVAQWHEFAAATAGASATLTGLLFVAISINLDRILEVDRLPRRAAGTMSVLLAMLVAAMFLLAPGQRDAAVGVEIAATGLALGVIAAIVTVRTERTAGEPLVWTLGPIVTLMTPAIALMVAGLSTALKGGGGLYWFLAAAVVGFSCAAANAWVLLVEVKR